MEHHGPYLWWNYEQRTTTFFSLLFIIQELSSSYHFAFPFPYFFLMPLLWDVLLRLIKKKFFFFLFNYLLFFCLFLFYLSLSSPLLIGYPVFIFIYFKKLDSELLFLKKFFNYTNIYPASWMPCKQS